VLTPRRDAGVRADALSAVQCFGNVLLPNGSISLPNGSAALPNGSDALPKHCTAPDRRPRV